VGTRIFRSIEIDSGDLVEHSSLSGIEAGKNNIEAEMRTEQPSPSLSQSSKTVQRTWPYKTGSFSLNLTLAFGWAFMLAGKFGLKNSKTIFFLEQEFRP